MKIITPSYPVRMPFHINEIEMVVEGTASLSTMLDDDSKFIVDFKPSRFAVEFSGSPWMEMEEWLFLVLIDSEMFIDRLTLMVSELHFESTGEKTPFLTTLDLLPVLTEDVPSESEDDEEGLDEDKLEDDLGLKSQLPN